MWGVKRTGVALAAAAQIHSAVAQDAFSYCPTIFNDAARVILRSPFLLSTDPSVNFQCHSCIANLAAKQPVAPLCFVVGMAGYDPQYSLAQDCHCLSLGLMEECAPVCLPNPICSKTSPSKACSACVATNAPATCNRNEWTLPCYETCQQPTCITECSPGPQCHPADAICAKCVSATSKSCDTTVATFGRQWSAACTATCYADACKADCARKCGDGIKTADEQCDDGNTNSGDGCSATCQIEAGSACVALDHALSSCHLVSCGDGKLEGSETCDDGNVVNGDGCSSGCHIERGATCVQASSLTGTSTCTATCGDGVQAVGLEGCDDGNAAGGDGCSATCTVEKGFACVTNAAGKSTCSAVCGDGILAGTEQCDDGNTVPFDGCSATCAVEAGYLCAPNTAGVSVCSASCGDGIVAFPVEGCDDGNRVSGDGCSATCTIEKGYGCASATPGAKSACAPVCGDALLTGAEACDDGNTLDNDGCSPRCGVEAGWTCDNTFKSAPKSVCTTICGDGLVKGAEQCDDTTRACINCKTVVVPPPRCGDGFVDTGETCDDGNSVAGDGCSATCQVESGYVCQGAPSVCSGVCGNGIKTSAEGCDDGNTKAGDGCSATCTVESGYACAASTAGLSACTPICGDGKVLAPETCDDGNTAAGDGCSAACQIEAGFKCSATTSGVSNCQATCGDGLVVGTEGCDDGNTKAGDGCSATCAVEVGFNCTTASPSVCSTTCGDGIKMPGEACDDGNTVSKDGCSATCTVETGYSCTSVALKTSTCTRVPTCGDGFVSAGEYCDDGNTVSGDGCSNRCRIEALYTCTSDSPSVCKLSNCNNYRKDWYSHTAQEKANFQSCVSKIYQAGIYQKMAGVHVYSPNDQYAHHTYGFVHWHRKWLLIVQNMLRSMGGVCSCINMPYWDWTEDAIAMQTSGCSSRVQCSGVLRDWGGGGFTSGTYKTIAIYSDPNSGVASSSTSGYCVLNNITKDWRTGMDLNRFKTAWDANCPVIRRGWDDFSDANGQYASPMAASSFLGLASSLAGASTFTSIIPICLGDIHVLPHDRSGAIMQTFISPADPIFLLHHGNIDRVLAIWEQCQGCINPSTATRTTNGKCYSGSGNGDDINTRFVMNVFDPQPNGQFKEVDIDSSVDFAEYVPRSFPNPGSVIDSTSLGPYAYTYETGILDSQMWKARGCIQANKPASVTLLDAHMRGERVAAAAFLAADGSTASTPPGLDLSDLFDLPDVDGGGGGGNNATFTPAVAKKYLNWANSLLANSSQLISSLQTSNLFSLPYMEQALGFIQSAEAIALDIAATCECVYVNKYLLATTGATELTPSFQDVSPTTKRMWNNSFHIRSCFHRMTDTNATIVLERQYCDVILSPDFGAKLRNLVNDLQGVVVSEVSKITGASTESTAGTIQQIWDYFTKPSTSS
ncbi:Aste57867_22422 [Aphanomyces stellatus]|uniref:Aste57867_22422 protein n=1 Tax=Aphanomyces stellatus TaxID=120398 RepID=A0A485LLD8_9STRA|nr:hypothetical protein As57867_022352 [Aphanomyces stellatus]VFT99084.1 Aste57867_22422 [Aphanomyces stellatus]